MTNATVALLLQPEDVEPPPLVNLSQGEIGLLVAFIVVIVAVFAIDMFRTWWETNRWRREERRRRRELL